MVKKNGVTKKQLEKYSEKLQKYLLYCQEYQEKLTAYLGSTLMSDPTTPPNGPKNPPKFP